MVGWALKTLGEQNDSELAEILEKLDSTLDDVEQLIEEKMQS